MGEKTTAGSCAICSTYRPAPDHVYGHSMSYSWTFLAVAVLLVLSPGADFAVIVRNTVVGGHPVGAATTLGVSTAAALQGLLVSFGLAGFIVRADPVFLVIKWAGIAYLAYLAATALLAAVRGKYPPAQDRQRTRSHSRLSGFRQGFLCNATNPKILVFYLALLPQFVGPAAPWWVWLLHAWTLPVLGTCWCLLIVAGVDRTRTMFSRRSIRRAIDAITGIVLLGFCAKLTTENWHETVG